VATNFLLLAHTYPIFIFTCTALICFMQKKTEKLFQNLENTRYALLSLTEGYTESQLNFKPATGEWSMAQVIKHLVMTETQILQYVQRRMEKGNLHDANLNSWMRYIMVKMALRFRKKIKAPKQVATPPEELDTAQVKKEWEQLRMQWKQTLQLMPPEMAGKNIFRHPLAGDMSISHTLGFMDEHIRHHIPQIKRIRQSRGWK
jgi:hypothetical protein